jgi:hypothetical protein
MKDDLDAARGIVFGVLCGLAWLAFVGWALS